MDVDRLRYVVADDLGQANDPTAVAVVERRLVPAGEKHQHTWRDGGDGGFEPEFAPPRAGEVQRIAIDAGRAARDLGWRAETGLLDGLRRTLSSI